MSDFAKELLSLARPVNDGCLAFMDASGACRGFVQLLPSKGRAISIHRLWTLQSGNGNGSMMLRSLCDLADRHGVEITLKPLPFGRKPYPMSRDQLLGWYQRHGFVGTARKMIRPPRTGSAEARGAVAAGGA